MDASLDTDIIIHLYTSGQQNLLHDFFDHLHIHEYLLNSELKKVAPLVYAQVVKDISQGQIAVVTTKDLIELGVKGLYESYLREYEYLFDSGELHAIALAKTLGLAALVSDDTKEFGPHDLLLRELIKDVIPLSFYELLFLRFLKLPMSVNELKTLFALINEKGMSTRPLGFENRFKRTLRRFDTRSGSDRDINWMGTFCKENEIRYNEKCSPLWSCVNRKS